MADETGRGRAIVISEGHLADRAVRIRVALLNDYDLVVHGLRGLLRPFSETIHVVERTLEPESPTAVDVSLLDTFGEQDLARHRLKELVADDANGAVVVFSFAQDPDPTAHFLELGAAGFISKAAPAPEIVRGLVAAATGERVVVLADHGPRAAWRDLGPETYLSLADWPGHQYGLTYRESKLLALLPTGMTNRELADLLYVSQNTIKTQLRSLFSKLGVKNRTQAAALVNEGYLGPRRTQSVPY